MAALSALGLVALAGLAPAAQFGLSMTRIHLGPKRSVETVTLSNQEATPLAFEVHVKRWRQDADGKWQLVPDDGLVVHPLILRIDAGGDGKVRIGTLSPTVTAEAAYRIELNEIPDRTQQVSGVRMLANISVPVFVQPDGAAPRLALAVADVGAHEAKIELRNTGTGYSEPGDASLRVLDANGNAVHEARMTTNYVLAGAKIPLLASIPAGACSRAASVELKVGDAAPLVAPVSPETRRCAP